MTSKQPMALTLSRRTVLGLALGGGLALAGCGGDGHSGADRDLSSRIYVAFGSDGASAPGAAPQALHVTLSGVLPQVAWYQDRPGRTSDLTGTQGYFAADWARIYGEVAPNALLQFEDAGELKALFGSVQNPRYDAAARTLQFDLQLTSDVSGVGSRFSRPVLTVLNNLAPPAEGSAFGMPAASATLRRDTAGAWQLALQGVEPQVVWMNNAPARGADFEAMGDFVNAWPDRFGQVPPNASVVGDPGDGSYQVVAMTLAQPSYDSATNTLVFPATELQGPGNLDAIRPMTNAVLIVDAGARNTPANVFASTWRGIAYSPIPSYFDNAPTGAFFDSDMTADAFRAVWGVKDGFGRNDLQTMADAGINLVRLYDYNFQRGTSQWSTGGPGHIPFLDQAQSLGIKVIIPVSNYNFLDAAGSNHPWADIAHTVQEIVASLKKNGAIHPAVHSFSIGNELDLGFGGLSAAVLIPRAVQVAGLLHQFAPDHYMTVPFSNAKEKMYYQMLRDQMPADLYQSRVYNSVQTFKLKTGDDLLNNILRAYDALNLGVPLVITELGTSELNAHSVDVQIDDVIGQAQAVREYMDATPNTLVKGFAIFQWQNANWKRGGADKPVNADMRYGIHAYDGTLGQSTTGKFFMAGPNGEYALFHENVTYNVDKLAPLTSAAHPEGLLQALSLYFK